MEESMKFNSSVCTSIEQSQRLLELGLNPETADMYYHEGSEDGAGNIEFHRNIRTECNNILFPDYIPAWSLHRLIELYKDVEDTSMWSLENVNYNRLIQCISLAIKHGAFNKQYLKQ